MNNSKIDDMKRNIVRLMCELDAAKAEKAALLAALDTANQTIREAQAREFALKAELERDLQRVKGNTDNMHSVPFLHRSIRPLRAIDGRDE